MLVLLAASVLLDRLNSAASIPTIRSAETAVSLAEAKAALIAWAVTHPDTPGMLPYPDGNADTEGYDGLADCAVAPAPALLLGRLPSRGEDGAFSACGPAGPGFTNWPMDAPVTDAAGESLWYAVSGNLLRNSGVPINSGILDNPTPAFPWISVRDRNGAIISNQVAAVIIAPGGTLSAVPRVAAGPIDQSGRAAVAAPAAEQFLDGIDVGGTVFANADADGCTDDDVGCVVASGEDFIVAPDSRLTADDADNFNDQLIFITVEELLRATEKRVLGEAERFLDKYRTTNGSYPWLADFRDPRGARGDASNGAISTIVMEDNDAVPAANFAAAGVREGDIIVNLTTGGRGYITDVAATSITFNALEGGSDAEFEFGDEYIIEPTFTSDMARNGLIPVGQQTSEIFKTGFTVKWNFSHIHELNDHSGGAASALVPITDTRDVLSDLVMSAPVVIGPDEGYCRWTTESRVDCYGKTVDPSFVRNDLPGPPTVQRTIEVNIAFDASGTDPGDPAPFVSLPAVVVNPPTATSPRTRDLSISSDFLATNIPVPLGGLAPELTLTAGGIIKTTDELLGDWGSQELTLLKGVGGANHGTGVITVSGIRYEDSIVIVDDIDGVDDQISEWFVVNDWHHYIYAAFSADAVAGGNTDLDDDCRTPADDCLTLNFAGNPVPGGVRGLVMSSSVPLPTQDRTIGDCDGDGDGQIDDPTNDSFLCAYFDSDDTALYDVSAEKLHHGANTLSIAAPDDTYARDNHSNSFNDQIRIIDLAP